MKITKFLTAVIAATAVLFAAPQAHSFTTGGTYMDEEGTVENFWAGYNPSITYNGVNCGIAACEVYNPWGAYIFVQWTVMWESTVFGDGGDEDIWWGSTDYDLAVILPSASYQYGRLDFGLWGNVDIEGALAAWVD